jgi:hypothetical protein
MTTELLTESVHSLFRKLETIKTVLAGQQPSQSMYDRIQSIGKKPSAKSPVENNPVYKEPKGKGDHPAAESEPDPNHRFANILKPQANADRAPEKTPQEKQKDWQAKKKKQFGNIIVNK